MQIFKLGVHTHCKLYMLNSEHNAYSTQVKLRRKLAVNNLNTNYTGLILAGCCAKSTTIHIHDWGE